MKKYSEDPGIDQENNDLKADMVRHEAQKRAAIMFALAVKESFELYSYRIVGPGDFIERNKELCLVYLTALKKSDNDPSKVDE